MFNVCSDAYYYLTLKQMQGAWLLPSWINIQCYNIALAKTLSIFPPVAGRMCRYPDEGNTKGDIYLKLNHAGITVAVTDDYNTEEFPMTNVGKLNGLLSSLMKAKFLNS